MVQDDKTTWWQTRTERVMKSLTETIVRGIVDYEDLVRVNVTETASTVVIEIRVAPEDMGKVIGKDGNMAWALRTLLTNAAAKHRKKALVHILE